MTNDMPRDDVRMTPGRFRRLVDAYGADPTRWPEAERADAEAFRDAAPETAAPVLAEARAIDALLDGAPSVPLSPAGRARLLAAARPGPMARLKALLDWPGSLWQPAGALAAALMLGVSLGVAVPDADALPGFEIAAAETPSVDAATAAEMASDVRLFLYGPAASAAQAGTPAETMQ